MKINSKFEVPLGAVAGILLGYLQSSPNFVNFAKIITNQNTIYTIAFFGGLAGFFFGMHLLSKSNKEEKKSVAYAFILCFCSAISIPTLLKDYNGVVIESLAMVSAFFGSIAIALFFGGVISAVFSKST